eukprot:TRINITY_DN4029_c0_g1_i2.p1 TRINITY_DN4029_c0_g1~~TRINITY_DN4029_c0_g1_i2.p1  ORF type:complete len:202 (-),score=28.68 TRINITY_DN4029_c0_g1_i2:283-888(-)
MKSSAGSGEWLEKALIDLCGNLESGLDLDRDLISGLVSYCELAPPQDAQEYLSDKDLLKKKQQEAEQAKRSKVVVTFDLVGRKVMVNEDEVSELKSEHSILRPQDERELNRIQPNPTIRVQPVFVDPGTSRNPVRAKQNTRLPKGICLEISGRVQHDISKLQLLTEDDSREIPSYNRSWQGPSVSGVSNVHEDEVCSIDYN